MPLRKESNISEIYDIEHRFDSKTNRHYPYENELLKKTTTPYLWQNPNMNTYLKLIEKMCVQLVEQMVIAKNFYVVTVHKYHDDWWG
jgi:hypothetical protein